MATPQGDVHFDAAGRGYVLRFGTNALCAVEDRIGRKLPEIIEEMQAGMGMGLVRVLFWGGLLKRQPGMTEDDAGDLMDAIGIQRASELVGEAFTAAFPEDKSANPPKAPAKKAA